MADTDLPMPIVDATWLAAHLDAPDVKVLDATFQLPTSGRDAAEEFGDRHIPGARFFDIDAVSDQTSDLPHMVPGPDQFADAMGALGVSKDDRVVVYDADGMGSAPRTWYLIRAFGHARVAVLDGGLPAWIRAGHPVASGATAIGPALYARPEAPTGIIDRDGVRAASTHQVVDARGRPRFEGAVEEPRAGLRRGHVPGARNLPFTELIDPETKTFRPADAVRARFEAAGIDDRPMILSCGSGVTACVLALGAAVIGRDDVTLYDGSWADWGRPDGPPIETGPARPL